MKHILVLALFGVICGCATQQIAEIEPSPTPSDLIASAKQHAMKDSRVKGVLAQYPDILDQPTAHGTMTEKGVTYRVVTFRKDNPRGASQYLKVIFNPNMTLRAIKEYREGH